MAKEHEQTTPKAESITLTVAELEAMMARVVAKERAEWESSATPAPSVPQKPLYEGMTPNERVEAELANERPKAPPLLRVPCISRTDFGGTGARFVVEAMPPFERKGRKFPERVLRLTDYTRPEGYDRPGSEANPAGLPDGYGVRLQNGEFVATTKQYIYQRFFQADLRAVVGRAVNPAFPMTKEEIATYYPNGLPADPEQAPE